MSEPNGATPMRRQFYGSDDGAWRVSRQVAIVGSDVDRVSHIAQHPPAAWTWMLAGTTSNLRYTTREERSALAAPFAGQEPAPSDRAVLIPIRKSAAWWALAQDERLAIYRRGRHTPIGLDHLPRVRRTLFHCRELGGPFDFLTWFEFDQGYDAGFQALLDALRASEEWAFVEREVEFWLEPEPRYA
ncbi:MULTISPECIES: chlorite dismutase family protein [unclassified Sphingomonas]|jgi:hypothetical protein|uniref:chlorite dismutase family protein n=1 Tax=unclassified Sphingomonas TaxID=196159 RepID=UPI000B0A88EC|nr:MULTISPECIES: chlorite dismutase family protein [unclassified Sphingomonas]